MKSPIQPYLSTVDQRDALYNALILMQNDCMKKLGFPPEPLKSPPTQAMIRADDSTVTRYFQITPEDARAEGYGKPHVLADADNDQKQQMKAMQDEFAKHYPSGPPPEYNTALLGPGGTFDKPGGCMGEAQTRVNGQPGTVDEGYDLTNRLRYQAFEAATASSEVQRAFKAWSACMAERGFHYPDPIAPTKDGTLNDPTKGRPVAMADVQCQTEADLTRVWNEADAAEQERLIEANFQALTESRRDRDERVRRAAAILEDHGIR